MSSRHQRTDTRWLVLLVSVVAATACTGAIGHASSVSLSPSPTIAPATRTMHDGPLGVFGALNGVRALTPVGLGRALFRCRTCAETTAADWSPDGTHLAFSNEDGLSVVDIADRTDHVVV